MTALLALVSAAIGGGIVALVNHLLTGRRERESKRRELIVRYLIETYDAIAAPSFLDPKDEVQAIERAVDRIQLLGDSELLKLTKVFCDDLKSTGQSDTSELMKYVRSQVRRELGLLPASQDFTILRFHELKE
ncbi:MULTISPECIES: hypothetical protein [unclassified Neorhizobium]|uniref:hypothetical protein n=1 Tax=unclassified Neorhizobium TaxID=2629175 RepID=UPI001FF252A1|nr:MULTISPECIES: hypothetical protein [unclassified Neorhizobium]MCJ9670308.1 hypothetical protein [Neorhizobium sp. SHOUNA12B]MCJ9743489.1 hypothetical protein [Neorhizobium sp. SHOUNA12A]